MSAGEFKTVIGLEIHVQLDTDSKMFCRCRSEFGAMPNSNVCPVCLGHPGALPTVNRRAVDLAIRFGLACDGEIQRRSEWARKNYFYPDLPKGYQITQYRHPICLGGRISLASHSETREIPLTRMHLEEDAGKLIHHNTGGAKYTAVDLNRCGTPLLEVVTPAVIASPQEAREFLLVLKQLLQYAGISACNMEKGELRVDANLSLSPAGSRTFGVKTEIKNLNSFRAVTRALKAERKRQQALLQSGNPVTQVTLLWDERAGQLQIMRHKEGSADYRYLPEPDLPDLIITDDQIARQREAMPELPAAKRSRLIYQYGIREYDAMVLTAIPDLADFFEAVAAQVTTPQQAASFISTKLLHLINTRGLGVIGMPLTAEALAELINQLSIGRVSAAMGQPILEAMWESGETAAAIIKRQDCRLIDDELQLLNWIQQTIAAEPEKVADYRRGRENLLNYFIGQLMARAKGRADPRRMKSLLIEALGRDIESED